MPIHEIPLTTPDAWIGAWVRSVSGPTRGSHSGLPTIGDWHLIVQIADATPYGLVAAHGPRTRILWPSMGARLEVFRSEPAPDMVPPGLLCQRCHFAWIRASVRHPIVVDSGYGDALPIRVNAEGHVRLADDDIERIAARVVELARAEEA